MPTIGIEGGRINIVPVDFVADAIDYIAHKKGLDGKCFHLTDPEPHRIGEVLNIFAQGRPRAADDDARQRASMFGFIPAPILYGLGSLAPVKRAMRAVLTDLGIPRDVFQFVNWPTRYDNREAAKALKGSGIAVPAARDLRLARCGTTGSATSIRTSSSIARSPGACATRSSWSPARRRASARRPRSSSRRRARKVILVARGEEKLLETKAGDRGRRRHARCIYTARRLRHGVVRRAGRARDARSTAAADYLVNNAGRSIRRGIINSFDRFHDFERTMQLNYFGALRLIMGFLPAMIEQQARAHHQHLVDRRAVECAALLGVRRVEVGARLVLAPARRRSSSTRTSHFTTINMPLVRTPMIAPTKMYENVPTLSPEEAADLVVEAIVHKPVRIATRLGIFGALCHAVAPRLTQILLNTAFNMFPDSAAAQGKKDAPSQALSPEQMAFAQLTQGIHW